MKLYTSIYLLTLIVVMSGCGENDDVIISPMAIGDIQIHVSNIDEDIRGINPHYTPSGRDSDNMNPDFYAVHVLVSSNLGGCRRYHRTRLFSNSHDNEIKAGLVTWHGSIPWIWKQDDTIILEITESEPVPDGSFDCTADFYYWYQAIFIGFCIPSEYTIVVNGNRYIFHINESDGTVRIQDNA